MACQRHRGRLGVCGAAPVARDGVGLRVLLLQSVDGRRRVLLGYNVHLEARRVVLVLAGGICRVGAGRRRPLPYPVEGERLARRGRRGYLDVRLAPLLRLRRRLPRDAVRELGLTLLRDGAGIQLMAAAVVEVVGRNQRAASVAAGAACRPLEHVDNLLRRRRLGCGVDEDGSGALGFAELGFRKRHMAVLQILHGNILARNDLQARICR